MNDSRKAALLGTNPVALNRADKGANILEDAPTPDITPYPSPLRGLNAGEPGATKWIDVNGDGLPDLWEVTGSGVMSCVTGNGFAVRACKLVITGETDSLKITEDANGDKIFTSGHDYEVDLKFRSKTAACGSWKIVSGEAYGSLIAFDNEGDAQASNTVDLAGSMAALDENSLEIMINGWVEGLEEGSWIEVDEIVITDVT